MARITLDPDEVNQGRVATTTGGEVVVLAEASAAELRAIARQLHVHRSSYAHAFEGPDQATTDAVVAGTRGLDGLAPLHVAVQEQLARRARERKRERRTGKDLDPLVLLDTTVWASRTGPARPLTDLTPSHRRNLLTWLERASDELEVSFAQAHVEAEDRARVEPADPWVAGTPLFRRLLELVEQESSLERAKDEARQRARQLHFDRTGEWPTAS